MNRNGIPSKVWAAREFAIKWHGDQPYGIDHTYEYHLDKVYEIGKKYGFDIDQLCGCFLHDVVEDTDCPESDIKKLFGQRVYNMVTAVTDDEGSNRKERKANTYGRILRNGMDAIKLKTADRIANVKQSIFNNPSLLKMYKKEHSDFKKIFSKFEVLPDICKDYITLMSNA